MLLLSLAINKMGLEQWRYDKLWSCQEQTKVESDHSDSYWESEYQQGSSTLLLLEYQ